MLVSDIAVSEARTSDRKCAAVVRHALALLQEAPFRAPRKLNSGKILAALDEAHHRMIAAAPHWNEGMVLSAYRGDVHAKWHSPPGEAVSESGQRLAHLMGALDEMEPVLMAAAKMLGGSPAHLKGMPGAAYEVVGERKYLTVHMTQADGMVPTYQYRDRGSYGGPHTQDATEAMAWFKEPVAEARDTGLRGLPPVPSRKKCAAIVSHALALLGETHARMTNKDAYNGLGCIADMEGERSLGVEGRTNGGVLLRVYRDQCRLIGRRKGSEPVSGLGQRLAHMMTVLDEVEPVIKAASEAIGDSPHDFGSDNWLGRFYMNGDGFFSAMVTYGFETEYECNTPSLGVRKTSSSAEAMAWFKEPVTEAAGPDLAMERCEATVRFACELLDAEPTVIDRYNNGKQALVSVAGKQQLVSCITDHNESSRFYLMVAPEGAAGHELFGLSYPSEMSAHELGQRLAHLCHVRDQAWEALDAAAAAVPGRKRFYRDQADPARVTMEMDMKKRFEVWLRRDLTLTYMGSPGGSPGGGPARIYRGPDRDRAMAAMLARPVEEARASVTDGAIETAIPYIEPEPDDQIDEAREMSSGERTELTRVALLFAAQLLDAGELRNLRSWGREAQATLPNGQVLVVTAMTDGFWAGATGLGPNTPDFGLGVGWVTAHELGQRLARLAELALEANVVLDRALSSTFAIGRYKGRPMVGGWRKVDSDMTAWQVTYDDTGAFMSVCLTEELSLKYFAAGPTDATYSGDDPERALKVLTGEVTSSRA